MKQTLCMKRKKGKPIPQPLKLQSAPVCTHEDLRSLNVLILKRTLLVSLTVYLLAGILCIGITLLREV